MPSGKTHDYLTIVSSPLIIGVARSVFVASDFVCILVASGYLVGGLLLSPDLDIKSKPFYRWGLIRFIWWPYQKLAKHRSALSHGWLLASWIRYFYLILLIIVVYSLYSGTTDTALNFVKQHYIFILWFGLGVWLGCLLHIVADHTVTFARNRFW